MLQSVRKCDILNNRDDYNMLLGSAGYEHSLNVI